MADQTPAIRISLTKGLAYLAKAQRPDGGFDSFSSPSTTPFKKAFTYQTTFVPAIMLAALSGPQTPTGRRITRQLAGYLKAQRSPGWSFNYWAADSPERLARPYPDDLDDTACALAGLFLYQSSLITAEVLAAFVKLLLATEAQVGGPYKTWLIPAGADNRWSDIDLAANANVAYFLSLVSQPLPNVTALMEQAIGREQLSSPYYPSTYPILYYLARAYEGPLTKTLRGIARRSLGTKANQLNALENALLLSASLRLNVKAAKIVADLLAAQRPDGSWPAEAFCLDPARGHKTYYHGSESLTTALALEALASYQERSQEVKAAPAKPKAGRRTHAAFQSQVAARNRHDWLALKPELRDNAQEFLRSITKSSDSAEIVALPQAFNKSLVRPLDKTQDRLLMNLGLANLYGWAAYTIYDDFLDDEGQPALLPVATTALRYSLEAFDKALPGDQAFRTLVRQTFDRIDGANAWELAHCRLGRQDQKLVIAALPDYGDLAGLAERSLGHSLTPLAVLRAKGIGLNSSSFHATQQAFIHYLAARQLNDDAHDWETDLRNGHTTYVVTRLLSDARVKPGSYGWSKLLSLVQKPFWRVTLPKICHDISQQTKLSRDSLAQLPELQPSNVLAKLLDRIDASVAETLAVQRQTQTFLAHYKNSSQIKL